MKGFPFCTESISPIHFLSDSYHERHYLEIYTKILLSLGNSDVKASVHVVVLYRCKNT